MVHEITRYEGEHTAGFFERAITIACMMAENPQRMYLSTKVKRAALKIKRFSPAFARHRDTIDQQLVEDDSLSDDVIRFEVEPGCAAAEPTITSLSA